MKRIFIEREKCDGCKNCSVACMNAHRATSEANASAGSVYDLDLTDPANEARHTIAADGSGLGGQGHYTPVFCRHCAEPDCAASCMSGALKKDPQSGHVQYDKDRCGKCFMCVMNCPYGNVKPDRVTKSFILKCDFCVNDGEEPNCVKACPTKALHVEEVYWEGVAI